MKHTKKEHAAAAEPAAAEPAVVEPAVVPVQPATPPAVPVSPAGAATPATPPPVAPAESELAALKDTHLRMMADFDNFRKRQTRDRDEALRRSTEILAAELLPVLDHLDLALANVKVKDDPFVKGVRMVSDQFLAALAKFDVRPFQTVGQPFDPARHEALTQQPSDTVPANHILLQLRCGYLIGSRLIRPAQVIISSGKPQAVAAPAPQAPDAPAQPPPHAKHA